MNLIYLHGFASSPQSNKAQYFRRKFAELGVDMQIPDLAEGDFENLTLSGQLRVIDRIAGKPDTTLIGSSMGGYLAALYAARNPQVKRIAVLAPAFGFGRRWQTMLGAEKIAKWKSTGQLPLFHYGDKRERSVGYKLLEDAGQYEDFPDVKQPVLIFHGRRDDVVPVELSERFAALHPQTDLRVVDSDHELLNVLDEMWAEIRGLQ